MMDCDTTGIEPDIALVKYKKLVGGGMLKIVNNTVPVALKRLGYDAKQVREIVEYITENDTIEGAPHLLDQHLTVFDCAFKPANGTRSIHYMGHLKMMGAVQPFISGAISKTINMPSNATVDEIEGAYYEAWKLGLKAVAVYRDGCKRSQPLSTGQDKTVARAARRRPRPPSAASSPTSASPSPTNSPSAATRATSPSANTKTAAPGEIFITMAKEGSTISGLMDSFATMTSLALQHGVPLQLLVDKFTHTRFEPSGFTKNPEIPMAKSIMDYIFKWLAIKFLSRDAQEHAGVILRDDLPASSSLSQSIPTPKATSNVTTPSASDLSFLEKVSTAAPTTLSADATRIMGFVMPAKNADGANPTKTGTFLYQQDAPSCSDCGEIMVRNGACYKCLNCGSTSGCS